MSTVTDQIATRLNTLATQLSNIKTSLGNKTGQNLSATALSALPDIITGITTGGGASWTPPSEWLSIPSIGDAEQKCYILNIVRQYMTGVSLTCAGAYTVDWGDGVTENFGSGVNAQHNYTFATITKTLTSGHKQVLITITPQAGQNLTSINLTPTHNSYSKSFVNGACSISINAPSLSSLTLQSVTANTSKLTQLEVFSLNKNNITANFSQLFNGLFNLKSIPVLDMTTCTSATYLFKNCYSLRDIPSTLATSNTTTMSNMFTGCYSLLKLPSMDTSKCTDFSSFISGCYALSEIPLYDTSKATTMASFAVNCYSLKSLPQFVTPLCTNFSSFVSGCSSLTELPAINISAATNLTSFAGSCAFLEKSNITGTPISISYASCNLSKDAIVAIFNNLPTVTNSSSITITSNPGTSSLTGSDNSIATGKGWSIITV